MAALVRSDGLFGACYSLAMLWFIIVAYTLAFMSGTPCLAPGSGAVVAPLQQPLRRCDMSSVPTTPTTSRPSPALRTPFSSPRQYTRLSSDDEADDAEPPAAVQPPRLDPETAQQLQRKFLSHVARARRRQTDAGAVVQLVVGGDAWVIDLRPQVPLAQVVQPGRVTAPDIRLAISPDDLQAVLDRRLSPFRAWQSKQLVVSGDLLKLRAMKWLRDGGAADEDDAGLSHERMGVRVVGTSTEGGFGSYMLRVTEGATAWSVSRRWSECKALVKALAREYGPGTPATSEPLA